MSQKPEYSDEQRTAELNVYLQSKLYSTAYTNGSNKIHLDSFIGDQDVVLMLGHFIDGFDELWYTMQIKCPGIDLWELPGRELQVNWALTRTYAIETQYESDKKTAIRFIGNVLQLIGLNLPDMMKNKKTA